MDETDSTVVEEPEDMIHDNPIVKVIVIDNLPVTISFMASVLTVGANKMVDLVTIDLVFGNFKRKITLAPLLLRSLEMAIKVWGGRIVNNILLASYKDVSSSIQKTVVLVLVPQDQVVLFFLVQLVIVLAMDPVDVKQTLIEKATVVIILQIFMPSCHYLQIVNEILI